MSVEKHNENPRKPTRSERIAGALSARAAAAFCAILLGKHSDEILREITLGICEDGILGSTLAFPDPEYDGNHLTYRTAHAGRWHSYDFRRAEFYPIVAEKRPEFTMYSKGILMAYLLDAVADMPNNERTDLTLLQAWSADTSLSEEKPGISRLVEVGVVEQRTQEEAFEQVGATAYIDELRAKGLAADPVYQVTPKGHGLVRLESEDGHPTPPLGDLKAVRGARLAHIQQS